jgi:3-oxoacyl-(acyl-carrier-protein) synthase
MGEGAGVVVLEEEQAPASAGARILGYLRGYASRRTRTT